MAANFKIEQMCYKWLQFSNFMDIAPIQSTNIEHIFLALNSLGVYLRIRGYFWEFGKNYISRDRVSALRTVSNNAREPEGCFFLRFLYSNMNNLCF